MKRFKRKHGKHYTYIVDLGICVHTFKHYSTKSLYFSDDNTHTFTHKHEKSDKVAQKKKNYFISSSIVFFFLSCTSILLQIIKKRCQCWMAFTWISSAMLCCPPLLGYSEPIFDKEAYICKLDWGNMAAYSATLAILVLGPSVISIVHNYGYIFIMMRRLKSGAPIHDKEYATALAENLANPSHLMSFALVFSFWVSWAPFIIVRIYELIFDTPIDIPMLHFAIVWLGVMNSFWKILIMMSMSPQFRLHLRVFCLTICCKTKGRLQAELIGLDPDD